MDAQEIINYIATSEKKTPVKVYVRERAGASVDYGSAKVFGAGDKIVFGNWAELEGLLAEQADAIEDLVVECDRRNSGVPLLDIRNVNARIEPGAIIRERMEIGDNAVIMMGAVLGGRAWRRPWATAACGRSRRSYPSWPALPSREWG